MFAKVRTSHLQHKEDSMLATVKGYEDEEIQRAELRDSSAGEGDYDPSLAKYFLMEDSCDEEEVIDNNVAGSKSKSKRLETKSKISSRSSVKKNRTVSSDSSENSDIEDEDSKDVEKFSEEENDLGTDNEEASPGFSFTDGDYSQYADDSDVDDDDSESSHEDEEDHSRMTVDDFDSADSEDSEAMVEAARQKLKKKKLLKRKQLNSNKKGIDSDEEDSNTDEDSEDDGENDSGVVDEEEEEIDITAVKSKNLSEEQKKAEAVTKQFDLYDKLFESRILLQKVVSSSHHLPQPDVYPAFKRLTGFEGQRYQKSLRAAIDSTQVLLNSMLQLQEALLLSTPDTASVLTDGSMCTKKPTPDDDDEEITSSEDEQDKDSKDKEVKTTPNPTPEQKNDAGSNKRKRTDRQVLEETEGTLAKRHCNMKTYRNTVVAYWEERTKLLQTRSKSSSRKGGSFEAFEESFSVMVARLLNDRDKVLRRTQLRSANRGNYATPIGGLEHKPEVEIDPELDIPKVDESGVLFQRYDPEIYDDTDFYSFALEQVIKTKMMRGTSSLTTAQFLDFTHKLRKKNKKIVDTKRSKGRKLKYDVHSALLQFLAPRGAPEMEDDAIDVVVHSLFGGQKLNTASVQPTPA
ncbi:Apoptosis-antagonizing transcription factor C-terminal [Trinorchestia longiramus]|nr:Apoptosis-antagonizing transcription factor C-terminal [Trinorchestia longiramus]